MTEPIMGGGFRKLTFDLRGSPLVNAHRTPCLRRHGKRIHPWQTRAVHLRIRFRPPGFFLGDARVVVSIGDRTLYDGSMLYGFDIDAVVSEGERELVTRIAVGNFGRTRRYSLPRVEDPYRGDAHLAVELRYSRFWGNFTRRLHRLPTD